MVHWSQSYKYGKAQEEKVIPELAAHFNKVVTPTTGQYAKYDCNDDDTNYEIKSRNNRMKAYPTTMITCNKFPKTDDAKGAVFVFNFTDCLAYIKYDAEKFSTYTTSSFSRLGCCWDEKEHIYIPVEHLSVIKQW